MGGLKRVLLRWVKLWVVARKTNLMLIGVLLSVVLVGCSSNATTTAETTVAKVCNPPAQLDCAGADLSGINLSGVSLACNDLSEAKPFCANLSGANLTDADLSDADLRGANLTGANLSGVDLSLVGLTGATMPDGKIYNP